MEKAFTKSDVHFIEPHIFGSPYKTVMHEVKSSHCLKKENVLLVQVQQAFGGNTWPLPNEKTATTPAVVIFKDKDISQYYSLSFSV